MSQVLVIDLDETLVETDISYETAWLLISRRPGCLLGLVWRLISQGRASAKAYIQCRQSLSPDKLPYRQEIIDVINEAKKLNKTLVLATGTHQKYAEQIANHTGYFDCVFGSSQSINLIGPNKQALLEKQFKAFEYIGDSSNDIPVWKSSTTAWIVNKNTTRSRRFQRQLRHCKIISVDPTIPSIPTTVMVSFIPILAPTVVVQGGLNVWCCLILLNIMATDYYLYVCATRRQQAYQMCLAKHLFQSLVALVLCYSLAGYYSKVLLFLSCAYLIANLIAEQPITKLMNYLTVGLLSAVIFI